MYMYTVVPGAHGLMYVVDSFPGSSLAFQLSIYNIQFSIVHIMYNEAYTYMHVLQVVVVL